MFKRSSGILMHISSLPNKFGIGTFGSEAYDFADFCKRSGFSYWQILPLNPTGYGDSPYQSFSAFAGNPYFIDLKELADLKLLDNKDLESADLCENDRFVNYGKIYFNKMTLLKKAYSNSGFLNEKIELFKNENAGWLNDYALYMSLKKHFSNLVWSDWDEDIKSREPEALKKYGDLLISETGFYIFTQYLFFNQWKRLKDYANGLGIKIIGDLPIYVSMDSADAWCGKNFLQFDENLNPAGVAGVPPDYFSKTGQLWGNPLYDWDKLKKDNFSWWVKRIKAAQNLYDVIRIDHFRGFSNYWKVPYGESNAIKGSWEKGPGISFFNKIKKECSNLNIIAEDLGIIDESVNILRDKLKLPGMKVLQFGYDVNDKDNSYLVHNVTKDCVYYIGTHDNDTLMGWYNKLDDKNKKYVKDYFGLNDEEGYNFGIIRGAFSSAADLVVICMQDILGLDSNSRMNTPSTAFDNWKWRAQENEISEETAKVMRNLQETFNR